MMSLPPPVMTNFSNAFAHHTMQIRVPRNAREVLTLNPDYSPVIRAAVEALAEQIENNQALRPLELFAPDYAAWLPAMTAHEGQTWLNTDWFFAEIYFYRLLMEAVRWWETGRDPFQPQKHAELASAALWELLEKTQALHALPLDERLYDLLHFDLWGNRIDLSLATAMAHGTHVSDGDLLVDEAEAAVRRLLDAPGRVHIITDNTGSELAMDLALAGALLANPAYSVLLNVKMHPTFVSDVTAQDVQELLAAMHQRGGDAARLAAQLEQAFAAGRLRIMPDLYWNSTQVLWDLPAHLAAGFRGASLVLIKGDANYRRLCGDLLWAAETPFHQVTAAFPAPLLALRTLKSDVLIGLPSGVTAALDQQDPLWRVNGKRGVIQLKL